MTSNPLNYRSPQDEPPSSEVRIEIQRTENGRAVVRVSCPLRLWRQTLISPAITCCVAVVLPAVALWTFWKPVLAHGWTLFLLPVIFPSLTIPLMIWRVWQLRQIYVLEADRDGITIQSYRNRREWLERLPREQITDVRIGFDRSGEARSSAWLIIATRPWYRFNRKLLDGLGGDNLARIANALRAAIGLPARSWP